MSLVSTFRWNCNLLPKFGKTQSHLINCVLFICSFFQLISNPINWILFFTYSIVKFHSHSLECWSVWMDSNHRPRAYQARALATWATDRFFTHWLYDSSLLDDRRDSEPITRLRRVVGLLATFVYAIFQIDGCCRCFEKWWRWRDSNPWPPACRAGALPTELHPHLLGLYSGLKLNPDNWTTKSFGTTRNTHLPGFMSNLTTKSQERLALLASRSP